MVWMVSFEHVPAVFPCLLPAYLLKRSVRKASGATSENVSVVKILMFSRATPAPGAQSLTRIPRVSWCFLSQVSTNYQHVSTLNKNGHTKAKKYDIQLHLLPYSFLMFFFREKMKENERNWKKLKEGTAVMAIPEPTLFSPRLRFLRSALQQAYLGQSHTAALTYCWRTSNKHQSARKRRNSEIARKRMEKGHRWP